MRISVITAVYNRRETIGGAIRSVQAQSHGNVEHIIQDGVSTDGTLEEIDALADERTCLVSTPDSGIYDAINRGIARASGDVIGLMHSDDLYADNDVLERVAAAFAADPSVDAVYGDLQYVAATNPQRIIRRWKSGEYHLKLLRAGWMPPHPTLYVRRYVFERFGDYDTSYRIAADYDAILRWLGPGHIKLAYIPQVLVKMRVGGESNRSLGKILRKSSEDYRAIRTNGIGGASVLVRKNLSKLNQFFPRTS